MAERKATWMAARMAEHKAERKAKRKAEHMAEGDVGLEAACKAKIEAKRRAKRKAERKAGRKAERKALRVAGGSSVCPGTAGISVERRSVMDQISVLRLQISANTDNTLRNVQLGEMHRLELALERIE